jgi:AP-4 complex subunit epsilon-1
MSAAVPNRDFFELVKAIGESKSKQEEDRIIGEEVLYLKKKIPELVCSCALSSIYAYTHTHAHMYMYM